MRRKNVLLIFVLFPAFAAGAEMPSELAGAAKQSGASAADLKTVETQPLAWIYERESVGRQVSVAGLARIPTSPQKLTRDSRSGTA